MGERDLRSGRLYSSRERERDLESYERRRSRRAGDLERRRELLLSRWGALACCSGRGGPDPHPGAKAERNARERASEAMAAVVGVVIVRVEDRRVKDERDFRRPCSDGNVTDVLKFR